jgi:hypothetical protein
MPVVCEEFALLFSHKSSPDNHDLGFTYRKHGNERQAGEHLRNRR